MRILFLCGSLEPGQDGVGDYTRRLACELIGRGHEACAISLFDRGVNEVLESLQPLQQVELPVLRIPFLSIYKDRLKHIEDRIKVFNPDWISLQYVPYSFQVKGFAINLIRLLHGLGRNRKWHIMFHEIWVGISKISSTNHKITGFFQKRIARLLVNVLNPKLITTSNRLYQLLLQNNKTPSTILPLFSNIPISDTDPVLFKNILTSLNLDQKSRNEFLIAGIFGSIYPEANLKNAITTQLANAISSGKRLLVIGFGRINDEGYEAFKKLELHFTAKVDFLHLGGLSEDDVSNVMQILDVALSCTPQQHITKSGVFAAMKLHDVNVIAPPGDIMPEFYAEINHFNEYLINRPPVEWSVGYRAEQFVKLLNDVN